MNKAIGRRSPASARNGSPGSQPISPEDVSVHAQARQLDAIFKSLARKVLVDDDPAADLPLRQLRVCLLLYDGPHSMTELSRELRVSQSAITQIADRLEAAKMAARGPVGKDRRVRSLKLTDRAQKMLRLREEGRIERMTNILKRMPADVRKAMLASLAALREAASEEH